MSETVAFAITIYFVIVGGFFLTLPKADKKASQKDEHIIVEGWDKDEPARH